MSSVSFTIPGRIGGKGRARSTASGHHYTPAKTRSDEGIVRHFALMASRETPLLKGPLKLTIEIWIEKPKSWSAKRKAAAVWVTGKPDWDNSGKLICDAMNHLVYADDSQIAWPEMKRRYCDAVHPAEEVRVTVEELE